MREGIEIKSKKEKINYAFFIVGLIVGIAGGIFGNILVTSMYRIIDQNPKGHNDITLIFGIIGFFVIICLLFNELRKIKIK